MQSSLQCTTQTSLRSIAAKLFAMKKSLADQVRDYLDFRGEDFTPAKLAADVAKLQRDLPEGKRCKRQNIEQLLERGFRTVLYVPALAAAMGTTVETLAAGAFVPGAQDGGETRSPAPAQGAPVVTLAQALEVVAGALSSVPVEKRQTLLGVLATYASDPAQESNSLSYLQSELAKTQARAGVHPSSIATGKPPGGKV